MGGVGVTEARTQLGPQDVRDAAATCVAALRPLHGADWSAPAGELEWSAQQTLDHVAHALLFYATSLATRATSRPAGPTIRAAGNTAEGMAALAAVLAAVAEAAPDDVRGWHGLGRADREGFMAMGCDEMLVHTNDIATGLAGTFDPPRELCRRVLQRLFPWAPVDVDPWESLLWANGRIALPGWPRQGPEWAWLATPLSEWDGSVLTAPP
jgi:hypothetical protein